MGRAWVIGFVNTPRINLLRCSETIGPRERGRRKINPELRELFAIYPPELHAMLPAPLRASPG